jgi:hypothetical protein
MSLKLLVCLPVTARNRVMVQDELRVIRNRIR